MTYAERSFEIIKLYAWLISNLLRNPEPNFNKVNHM